MASRGLRLLVAAACALAALPAENAMGSARPGRTGTIAFVRFLDRVGHPRINVIDVRGGPAHGLRLPVTAADGPSWSTSGRRLVFVGGLNRTDATRVSMRDGLYVTTRAGKHTTRITHDAGHEVGPAWCPARELLAYVRSAPHRPDLSSIYLIRPDGTQRQRLTRGFIDLQPSWSRDGRLIAFLRIDPKTYATGIWVIRRDGTGLQRILSSMTNVTEPVWSPAARRLVVTDGTRLMVVNANGSGLRTIARLTADASGDRIDPEPAWAPDGSAVAFAQMRKGTEGHSDIWAVNADGTGLRRITRSPGRDFAPTWSTP
ncbi:MAG: TolB family protein [Actinomycetota bacterium]